MCSIKGRNEMVLSQGVASERVQLPWDEGVDGAGGRTAKGGCWCPKGTLGG
jgi:hypothetical protein